MLYSKYHALGNDYIVIDPANIPEESLDPVKIRRICHRNFGIGSDGILLGPLSNSECDFGLRIFNPDGSEAEKSGNGIRIFSRYLWEKGLVKDNTVNISTIGGNVSSQISENGKIIKTEMGKVSFTSNRIPVKGPLREVINETIKVGNKELTFSAVTIGNPHCVVTCKTFDGLDVRQLGKRIEKNNLFPNRTNVQFMKVLDRKNIQIEIWERGAGYTLASGSSSSAAAAVAHRLGCCDSDILVLMPGGQIEISIGEDYSIIMTGPVTKVAEGNISEEVFEWE